MKENVNFYSKTDKLDFILISVAVFLIYITNSSYGYLSVVLQGNGFLEKEIGQIISFIMITMLLAIPISGFLTHRKGAYATLLTGLLIVLIAYLSYHFTQRTYFGLFISRLIHGFGIGIFFSAAIMYGQAKLTDNNKLVLFGIYTTMFSSPNVFGPGYAELLYKKAGAENLFLLTMIPAVIGLLIILFLLRNRGSAPRSPHLQTDFNSSQIAEKNTGYLGLIKNKGLLFANINILLTGILFGFVISFFSLYLKNNQIPVVYFFSIFAAMLFLTRVVFMQWLKQFSKNVLVLGGLCFMSLAFVAIAGNASITTAVLSGFLFGSGLSVLYPVLNIEIIQLVKKQEQPHANALFNFCFNMGIFSSPLAAGYAIHYIGIQTFIFVLGFVVFLLSSFLSLIARLKPQYFVSPSQAE